jgi:hypothetical protein
LITSGELISYKKYITRYWWLMPITLATQEAEIRMFEASRDKQFMRPYLEKTHHKKGLVEQLKV